VANCASVDGKVSGADLARRCRITAPCESPRAGLEALSVARDRRDAFNAAGGDLSAFHRDVHGHSAQGGGGMVSCVGTGTGVPQADLQIDGSTALPRTRARAKGQSQHLAAHRNLELALERLQRGAPVVLQGSQMAEVIVPARSIDASTICLLLREARGPLRVVVTPTRSAELALVPLVSSNATRRETWCVSVEARHRVSTGVSASDRARTIRVLGSAHTGPEDLAMPGHILPIVGGLHRRTPETSVPEAALALCQAASAGESATLCHLLADDGSVARPAEAAGFARRHDLPILPLACFGFAGAAPCLP
jgi:3,4-dihydroxy-2-butanone 4-phosphate synthase